MLAADDLINRDAKFIGDNVAGAQTGKALLAAAPAGYRIWLLGVLISQAGTGDVTIVSDTAGTKTVIVPKVYQTTSSTAHYFGFESPVPCPVGYNVGYVSTGAVGTSVALCYIIAPA